MRGDVAHDVRQVLLVVPAQVAREERDVGGQRRIALHLDRLEGGLLARGQARHEERRDAHLEIGRRAFAGRDHLAGGLDGERHGERAHVDCDGAPGMGAQAVHRARGTAQHMVHGALAGMREDAAHAFHPRCSATTPAARLKYSTRARPAACIMAFNVSWSGCMRIDSAR